MLSDEEKQAIERLNIYKEKIKDELYPTIDFEEEKAIGVVLNLIEKQSKEIEELKDFITKLQETKDRLDSYDKENTLEIEKLKKEIEGLKEKNEFLNWYFENQKENFIHKDKINEILEIEEDIDNEKLLSLLQTIVDENVRLEDIEDRKVQIEYNNVFNKGVKSVEDKIKAKILECRKILYSFEKELELKANKDKFIHKESMNCLLGQISILQSLLEKE